eukprot:1838962-Pyramimonas_sp.AAC.1
MPPPPSTPKTIPSTAAVTTASVWILRQTNYPSTALSFLLPSGAGLVHSALCDSLETRCRAGTGRGGAVSTLAKCTARENAALPGLKL